MGRTLSRWAGAILMAWAAILWVGCGEDSSTGPTTGTVSGTVTFRGESPDEGRIVVGLFAVWPPMGPPAHYIELTEQERTAEYTIPGVSFGTYAAVAVGWRRPGQMDLVIGAYGFRPPEDMEPDAIVVGQDDPDQIDIDIAADYALLAEGGPPS